MFLKHGNAIGVVREKEGEHPDRSVRISVENVNNTIYIKPEGYGYMCSLDNAGIPVLIEIWEDELRVVVWSDINQEDPTHIISLEKAREENRNEP